MLLHRFTKQVHVDHALGVGGEDNLPRVPALGDVVRDVHSDDTG